MSVGQLGTTVAGSEFTLMCNVTEAISGLSNVPTATWLYTDGEPVTSTSDITIETTHTESISIATLTFNPLRVAHGRVYRCIGSLVSAALEDVIVLNMDETLAVQGKYKVCFNPTERPYLVVSWPTLVHHHNNYT